MSDDAIKRALEVAALTACDGSFDRPCSHPSLCADAGQCLNDIKREEYAAAIAAFLDALPPVDVMMAQRPHDPVDPGGPHSTRTLAAAVRRAAGGG